MDWVCLLETDMMALAGSQCTVVALSCRVHVVIFSVVFLDLARAILFIADFKIKNSKRRVFLLPEIENWYK